jgi:hypothetical protein
MEVGQKISLQCKRFDFLTSKCNRNSSYLIVPPFYFLLTQSVTLVADHTVHRMQLLHPLLTQELLLLSASVSQLFPPAIIFKFMAANSLIQQRKHDNRSATNTVR